MPNGSVARESMDSSNHWPYRLAGPVERAILIAKLTAEENCWNVFLCNKVHDDDQCRWKYTAFGISPGELLQSRTSNWPETPSQPDVCRWRTPDTAHCEMIFGDWAEQWQDVFLQHYSVIASSSQILGSQSPSCPALTTSSCRYHQKNILQGYSETTTKNLWHIRSVYPMPSQHTAMPNHLTNHCFLLYQAGNILLLNTDGSISFWVKLGSISSCTTFETVNAFPQWVCRAVSQFTVNHQKMMYDETHYTDRNNQVISDMFQK